AAQELCGARPALWGHGGAYDGRGILALHRRPLLSNTGPRARIHLAGVLDLAAEHMVLLATPAQVDGRARANLSAIGDWARPKLALGGTRGLPDAPEIHFVLPGHSARQLVSKVDFVSTDASARTVAPRLFTELAVLEWRSEGWRLAALLGAATAEDVQARTGFALDLSVPPERVPDPDAAFLAMLDQVDPMRVRALDFAGSREERVAALRRIEAAERQRTEP
ncbi:MAG TPA: hypothetical protein VFR34_06370, partial [Paracoccaceae bacterium]|nr:hypothetical protein [Paracoccaceae bacterium]